MTQKGSQGHPEFIKANSEIWRKANSRMLRMMIRYCELMDKINLRRAANIKKEITR